ncbi:MAG TPA: hypothetical protein VGI60_13985 [Chthoniobacterales bacterium]|jgi:hypothetical protein
MTCFALGSDKQDVDAAKAAYEKANANEDHYRGTIILLNADSFIYTEGGNVYFHSRVKE